MKLIARKKQFGEIFFVTPESEGWIGEELGEVEIDIKPVKKWVMKEVQADSVRYWTSDDVLNGTFIGDYARNIKITYEVEE